MSHCCSDSYSWSTEKINGLKKEQNASIALPANIYLLKVNNNRNTRKKVWNMFKVNNKNTRTTSLIYFISVDNCSIIHQTKINFRRNFHDKSKCGLQNQYLATKIIYQVNMSIRYRLKPGPGLRPWTWEKTNLLEKPDLND